MKFDWWIYSKIYYALFIFVHFDILLFLRSHVKRIPLSINFNMMNTLMLSDTIRYTVG